MTHFSDACRMMQAQLDAFRMLYAELLRNEKDVVEIELGRKQLATDIMNGHFEEALEYLTVVANRDEEREKASERVSLHMLRTYPLEVTEIMTEKQQAFFSSGSTLPSKDWQDQQGHEGEQE